MKSNLIHFYNPVLHFKACAWVHTLWSVSPSHLLCSCSSYSHQPPSTYACWTLTAGKCSYTEFLLHSIWYDIWWYMIIWWACFFFFFLSLFFSGSAVIWPVSQYHQCSLCPSSVHSLHNDCLCCCCSYRWFKNGHHHPSSLWETAG